MLELLRKISEKADCWCSGRNLLHFYYLEEEPERWSMKENLTVVEGAGDESDETMTFVKVRYALGDEF